MKILLVEDDEDKREQLMNFVIEKLGIDFKEARSYQGGLRLIKEEQFDLILLDMTMPTFDISSTENGGRSQPFGGEMLLYEIIRREIKSKVIVVTQFDIFGKGDEEITIKDLDLKLSTLFKDTYLGIVQYNISYTGWKDILYDKIKNNFLIY
jgi:CheY-like chemotaxis protein